MKWSLAADRNRERNGCLVFLSTRFGLVSVFISWDEVFSVCESAYVPDCCSRVTLCDTVVRRAPVARVALAILGDSSRKSLLEKDVRHSLASGGKKQNKTKTKRSFAQQKYFHLEFRQISRRWAVHCECDSSATKRKYLHLWYWRHLPGLPAFHNLSICELYVLILFTKRREIWERRCSKH